MQTENQSQVIICVAPSGGRRSYKDHPNIPLTPTELSETAVESLDAGASVFHLHVRDHNLRHVLDVSAYKTAIQAIYLRVGKNLVIQVTTESCGLYQPEQQIKMVKELRPEAVTLSLMELIPDTAYEVQAGNFFSWLSAERIFTQFIVFNSNEVKYLAELVQRGIVPSHDPCVLYVLGRYSQNQLSIPSDLDEFLEASFLKKAWFVCAFGKDEARCIDYALSQGGHARIGFENNLFLPNGKVAKSNAELVRIAAIDAVKRNRVLADSNQARHLFSRHL